MGVHPSPPGDRNGARGLGGGSPVDQMELAAVINGLKALKAPSDVEVITDSTYVAKGSAQWMPAWKANGWKRKDGRQWKPVKNQEYWQELDELMARHHVRFTAIRGHAGHAENERCDQLAVAAALEYQ